MVDEVRVWRLVRPRTIPQNGDRGAGSSEVAAAEIRARSEQAARRMVAHRCGTEGWDAWFASSVHVVEVGPAPEDVWPGVSILLGRDAAVLTWWASGDLTLTNFNAKIEELRGSRSESPRGNTTSVVPVADPVCERPRCRHRRSEHNGKSSPWSVHLRCGVLRCGVEGCPCNAGRDAGGLWHRPDDLAVYDNARCACLPFDGASLADCPVHGVRRGT